MKLTIEHFAAYAPHQINVITRSGKIFKTKTTDSLDIRIIKGQSPNGNKQYHSLTLGKINKGEFKLLLHPLSDLTKEIEHNGEKIIFTEWILENSSIGYDPIKELVERLEENTDWIVHVEYYIIKYLLSMHFDIFDLISQKVAIDISTI